MYKTNFILCFHSFIKDIERVWHGMVCSWYFIILKRDSLYSLVSLYLYSCFSIFILACFSIFILHCIYSLIHRTINQNYQNIHFQKGAYSDLEKKINKKQAKNKQNEWLSNLKLHRFGKQKDSNFFSCRISEIAMNQICATRKSAIKDLILVTRLGHVVRCKYWINQY